MYFIGEICYLKPLAKFLELNFLRNLQSKFDCKKYVQHYMLRYSEPECVAFQLPVPLRGTQQTSFVRSALLVALRGAPIALRGYRRTPKGEAKVLTSAFVPQKKKHTRNGG